MMKMDFKPITIPENIQEGDYSVIQDAINKSLGEWFTKIENKLREIKELNCPEATDEEFAKIIIVEFNLNNEGIPYAIIRLKTAEELLDDIYKNDVSDKCFMKL